MKLAPISIWRDSEYAYPMAFGFRPDMVPYIHEDETVRPCVIVVPGGGYSFVSPSEGELVADRFYDAGYQTFVFTYTTNLLKAAPLMDLPMGELARAVRLVRTRAGEFKADPNRVILCSFSAGGHLCGSLCVHFDGVADPDPVLNAVSPRPDAAILSYPVITSGEYAHRDSFQCLLGRDIYERKDEEARRLLDYYSLENHVTAATPPCFLWQTVTDELVPVENSVLMARALKATTCRLRSIYSPAVPTDCPWRMTGGRDVNMVTTTAPISSRISRTRSEAAPCCCRSQQGPLFWTCSPNRTANPVRQTRRSESGRSWPKAFLTKRWKADSN